ncbi:MAG: winged helix-turn-helix domain-containing protein [Bacteroidota bacterium]
MASLYLNCTTQLYHLLITKDTSLLPYRTILQLDRSGKTPLYLQISNQLIQQINGGTIPRRYRLPGARTLTNLLGVSRKTVNLAYEELEAQGWIEIMPQRGTFVSVELPVIAPKELAVAMDREALNSFQPEKNKTVFPLHTHLDFLHHYSPPNLPSLH